MVQTVIILISIFMIIAIYKLVFKARNKVATNKVIPINRKKKSIGKEGKKACSFCHKKVKRLSFYVTEMGKVVGVCEGCKPQAERRALSRL
ncbi:hypothetical protein GK047_09755 [Paenibacillus sp. SYP-B3998]|uniref:Uncharacterized protein n=1 Tax=Paenibacillus sp. SYP-B3998 TaxID=2678564 RepID=A0A6G3ZVP6_9BACL|nr:hypothetical protein [Paenibacillus sp. SYP-B3998]NEW06296.1 hypothetical protein [Paenibacillus sp. SYP-B3998]